MDKNVYRHQLKGVIEFRYVADKEQKKEKRIMTDNELLLAISSMMDEDLIEYMREWTRWIVGWIRWTIGFLRWTALT